VTKKLQLFLHIGHPKTASSTMQAFLFKNWRALEAVGLYMPSRNLEISSNISPPENPLWALQNIRQTQNTAPLVAWVKAAVSRIPTTGKLLLSSECLTQPEWPALLSTLPEIVDINLIYYIRRQDQLLLSAWRQWGLKRGLTLQDFLARRLKNKQPDFLNIIQGWTKEMPVNNIHVRFIHPPFLTGSTIIEDFCTHMGLKVGGFLAVKNQNISIDARLALFLCNHPELFSSIHDEEIFNLLGSSSIHEPEVRLQFNEHQFQAIYETFEPLNQQLLKAYHPNKAGTPVIDKASAHIGDINLIADKSAQIEYIRKRLETVAVPHEKLQKLQAILHEEARHNHA